MLNLAYLLHIRHLKNLCFNKLFTFEVVCCIADRDVARSDEIVQVVFLRVSVLGS
jgi:hypothetical protein